MRGRPRNKGPNPLTRSYESNGPDVKVRGTAQHIADKYAQLARDSTASGDPVSAENYHQHAEHYYRLIAAAQEQYRQQYGVQQRPFDEDGEEGEDGEYGYGPERAGQANPMDEFADAPVQFDGRMNNPERGNPNRFNDRNGQDRGGQDRNRYDRNDRFDRQGQGGGERFDRNARGPNDNRGGERFDRNGQNGERYDRNDRGGNERFDRQGGGQNGERFDRQGGGERAASPDRNERPNDNRERYDRNGQSYGQNGQGQNGPGQNGEGRPAREGGRENGRRDRNRERFAGPSDEAPEPAIGGALPAFLTNPVRTPPPALEERPEPAASSVEYEAGASDDAPAPEPRARRTRRPRRTEQPEALDFGGPEAEKPAE